MAGEAKSFSLYLIYSKFQIDLEAFLRQFHSTSKSFENAVCGGFKTFICGTILRLRLDPHRVMARWKPGLISVDIIKIGILIEKKY